MSIEVKKEPSLTIVEDYEILDVAGTHQGTYISEDDLDNGATYSGGTAKRMRALDDSDCCSIPVGLDKDSNLYDEMQQLLKQWGLEELTDRFAINLIDVSVLDYILEVDILELCKDLPLRYRIVLRHQLNEKNYAKPNPVPAEPTIPERRRKIAVPKNRQTAAAGSASLQTSKPDQPAITDRQAQPSSSVVEYNELAQQCAQDSYEVKIAKLDCTLIELCQLYDPGHLFLQDYKIENGKRKYPVESRNHIKKVITEHFWRLRKGSLTSHDFERMTQIIIDELPDEEPSIWYASNPNTSQKKGLLYSRYRYLKRHDTRYKKCKDSSLSYREELTERAKQNWNGLSTTEQEICITARKQLNTVSNVGSQAIADAWKACFPLRRYEAAMGTLRLEDWHALSGYQEIHDLFSYDFCATHLIEHKTVDDRMIHFIERYKVIYSSYKSMLDADKLLGNAITDTVLVGNEITDHSKFLVLYSLPLMVRQLNPRIRLKRKFTLDDSRNSFITLLESKQVISQVVERRKPIDLDEGEPLKPFIAAIGSITYGITEYYVVLDSLRYECRTAPEAVDLLMKLYTVTHLEFSCDCDPTLRIIQSFFYDLDDDTKVNPSAKAFLTDLSRL